MCENIPKRSASKRGIAGYEESLKKLSLGGDFDMLDMFDWDAVGNKLPPFFREQVRILKGMPHGKRIFGGTKGVPD